MPIAFTVVLNRIGVKLVLFTLLVATFTFWQLPRRAKKPGSRYIPASTAMALTVPLVLLKWVQTVVTRVTDYLATEFSRCSLMVPWKVGTKLIWLSLRTLAFGNRGHIRDRRWRKQPLA